MNDENEKTNLTAKTSDINSSVEYENHTLGYFVESEMLSMGLDPKSKEDCDYFWRAKGLVE
jgi:hypothetical protein